MDIRKVKFFFVFLFVYCLLTEITKGQTAKIYEKELSLKAYTSVFGVSEFEIRHYIGLIT